MKEDTYDVIISLGLDLWKFCGINIVAQFGRVPATCLKISCLAENDNEITM
jgi:hypothetical protein